MPPFTSAPRWLQRLLVAAAAAILLFAGNLAASALLDHGASIAKLQAQRIDDEKSLERIEHKVDGLYSIIIERLPPKAKRPSGR